MNALQFRNSWLKVFLRWLVASCMAATAVTVSAATPKVITIAGGYVGDGKPATSASLEGVAAVVGDAKGNLYVSDISRCRIRKINKLGIITTFAGTGICGYSGDGGPAKAAMLNFPEGLAFDTHGNLFIADAGNSVIRKISPTGIITTVAGNGVSGYSGDGGPATAAELDFPQGVAVDPTGTIYIADSSNFVIRKVNKSGTIHTVAGNHTSGFSGDGGPATSAQISFASGVLVDGNGNFYIADSGSNERVRKVDSTGTITTYAGNGQQGNGGNGGPATSASIGLVDGLSLGGGELYITTVSNVWAVDLTTQLINIVAGNADGTYGFNGDGQLALNTSFSSPWGMTFDGDGNLLIADDNNNRIRKIDSSQVVTTIGGGYVGDGGKALSASLGTNYLAGHIAFDPAGDLYIADTDYNRVRKVSPTGIISTVAGSGIAGYSGDGGPATAATLNFPAGVAADELGNLFIADNNNGVIRRVDGAGTITTLSHTFASGLAVDSSGNVYAAGIWQDVIWKITPAGSASIVAGVQYNFGYNGDGIPATQAWLGYPAGVAVDKAGNLYIADWLNNRIRKVDTSGIISTVAGNGLAGYSGDGGPATSAEISLPVDVGVDAKGNFYIADASNARVRVVDSAGTINTFAGTGTFGYNGNGLPATSTNIFPVAVNVNPKGVVYVTDQGSYRVRKIH